LVYHGLAVHEFAGGVFTTPVFVTSPVVRFFANSASAQVLVISIVESTQYNHPFEVNIAHE